MTDDQCSDLIRSDLENTRTEGKYSVEIRIYRSAGTQWFLELVAGDGHSTLWEEVFESDDAAFGEAILAIREEGIQSFYATKPH